MNFNSNKLFSSGTKSTFWRIGAVLLTAVIGILIWHVLIPYANQLVGTFTTNELIACITLFVSLGTIVFKVSDKLLEKNYTAKRRISLDVNVESPYVVITCKVENCSSKRIIPQNIYLMVEAGIEKEGVAEFPYLLKHEQGEFDCVFANLCKNGGFTCLPEHLLNDEYKGLYRKIVQLKHLSSETILFIDPGEAFSEDVVLRLQKGVYKATAVWVSVKEDCICGTKGFVVR